MERRIGEYFKFGRRMQRLVYGITHRNTGYERPFAGQETLGRAFNRLFSPPEEERHNLLRRIGELFEQALIGIPTPDEVRARMQRTMPPGRRHDEPPLGPTREPRRPRPGRDPRGSEVTPPTE